MDWCGQRMRQCCSETIPRVTGITNAKVRAEKAAETRKNPRTERSGEGWGGQWRTEGGGGVLCWRAGKQAIVMGKSLSFSGQDEIQADYCLCIVELKWTSRQMRRGRQLADIKPLSTTSVWIMKERISIRKIASLVP